MATLNAINVVSFAKIKLSSVQNATIFSTANVGDNFNSGFYSFLLEKEIKEQDCKICYHEVKREYGCYCCLKKDCNYVVHVNCAIEDKNLYYIVDSKNQDEPIEKSIESSITCVFEVNEYGEATKIKHFSHEHCLSLEDTIKDDDDKHFDGCTLSILDSFYSCS
ncbi:hypothetical protein CRYUN_Cryun41cG0042300 [Craigia yunnanensis]